MQNRFAEDGAPSFRHEYKFYISPAGHAILSSLLRGALKPDDHADSHGEYFIRSLYFDDAYDTAYHEKMSGVGERKKYRIRTYNHRDGEIFLECKHKVGDLIEKSSARITRRLCDQLIDGRPDGLWASDNQLVKEVFRQMRLNALRPAVIVDYYREAYIYPVEDVRITFDKRLRTGMFSHELFDPELPTISPLDDDRMILEVKYDLYLPHYIRALLSQIPAESMAISKYTLCRRYHALDF